jgi:hypothetical protein
MDPFSRGFYTALSELLRRRNSTFLVAGLREPRSESSTRREVSAFRVDQKKISSVQVGSSPEVDEILEPGGQ